jgi:hypothetical protein
MSCAGCGQALGARAWFRLQASDGLIRKCLPCALRHPPILRRSVVIALVVGTILTAINQGDLLLGGHWAPALLWKIPLTYAIPFIVAMLGALSNAIAPRDRERG